MVQIGINQERPSTLNTFSGTIQPLARIKIIYKSRIHFKHCVHIRVTGGDIKYECSQNDLLAFHNSLFQVVVSTELEHAVSTLLLCEFCIEGFAGRFLPAVQNIANFSYLVTNFGSQEETSADTFHRLKAWNRACLSEPIEVNHSSCDGLLW